MIEAWSKSAANFCVAGDRDVLSPQAYLRDEDQESVVAGRGDSRRSAVQTGQPARTLPYVATALEPNVRGQPSAGCELPRPLHVALRMILLSPILQSWGTSPHSNVCSPSFRVGLRGWLLYVFLAFPVRAVFGDSARHKLMNKETGPKFDFGP